MKANCRGHLVLAPPVCWTLDVCSINRSEFIRRLRTQLSGSLPEREMEVPWCDGTAVPGFTRTGRFVAPARLMFPGGFQDAAERAGSLKND